jgi:hypothetical protein
MANTAPTFFRRFQVFAGFQSTKKSKILEPVQITLGFKGPVDPESGMVLNLVEIDAWIKKFKTATAKKIYVHHWDFCRSVKRKLEEVIHRKEFSEIRFSFHSMSVEYVGTDVLVKWDRQSLLQSGKTKWISPVTLTTKLIASTWPPLNSALLNKIDKDLQSVNLDKLSLKHSDLEFLSFDYLDIKLNSKVRLQLPKLGVSKKSDPKSRTVVKSISK